MNKRFLTALPAALLVFSGVMPGQDTESIVFHSDVVLARVDVQVVDGHNRTVTGLTADSFQLREDGKPQAIKNFANENMPVDILLLLDVSASMRPHVERISNAAHDALRVLGDNDRVGIMVFDTTTRLRLSFRSGRAEINRGLSDVLNVERFNGGTHITHAMMSAADYVRREARPEARRAIVILTDDGSQDTRNDMGVERALAKADAVLSYLHAPEVMMQRGGGYPGRTGSTIPGGTWPGSGPVILGGGGRRGGSRYPGGGGQQQNHSAGTADIAKDSGGDTFEVGDASALEDTLARLRQRYALHFNSSENNESMARRTLSVDLTDAARRRYPDAEVRYRRVYLSGNSREAGEISITKAHSPEGGPARSAMAAAPATGVDELTTPKRRRMSVDQNYGSGVHIARDEDDTAPAKAPEK